MKYDEILTADDYKAAEKKEIAFFDAGYRAAMRDHQEIINRDIAEKPIPLDAFDIHMCRVCSKYIDDGNFCKHCGHRIDWGKEWNS